MHTFVCDQGSQLFPHEGTLGLNWLAQETLCCVRVLQMALSKCYSQCVYVKEVAARVRCSNYRTVVSFPTCGQRLLHNWYTKDKGLLT